MSDHCKQCSEAIFGEDFQDLAGLSTEADTEAGLYTVVVCEGCGVIQVDHLGNCVSKNCLEKGHTSKHTYAMEPDGV